MQQTVTDLIVQFLIQRAKVGVSLITSHELENEGRRFIERGLGKTVNPSTISRKWRLLKVEYTATNTCDDDVVVKTLKKGKDGHWGVLSILGETVQHIHRASQRQLELNFEESKHAEDQAQYHG